MVRRNAHCRCAFHAGRLIVRKSTDRPDVEIRISSRFTARSLCRNRGPCWSARPPSLRCALRFGLLFSRFSVLPSLRGLSSRHPIPCRRLLSRSRGLAACRARYLLGLPSSGALRLLPGWYQSGVSSSPFVVKTVCDMSPNKSSYFE